MIFKESQRRDTSRKRLKKLNPETSACKFLDSNSIFLQNYGQNFNLDDEILRNTFFSSKFRTGKKFLSEVLEDFWYNQEKGLLELAQHMYASWSADGLMTEFWYFFKPDILKKVTSIDLSWPFSAIFFLFFSKKKLIFIL